MTDNKINKKGERRRDLIGRGRACFVLLFCAVLAVASSAAAERYLLDKFGWATLNYSHPYWGDCDNDGLADLVLAGDGKGLAELILLHNQGGNRFVTKFVRPHVDDPGGRLAAWIDYNGDGYQDLVVWSGGATPIYLYRNDGECRFAPDSGALFDMQTTYAANRWAKIVRVGDFDGDQDQDLLFGID